MEVVSSNYKKHVNKNPLMRLVLLNFLKDVKRLIDPLGINNILDVGCGEGFVINFLGKKCVTGFDVSKDVLDIAKMRNPTFDFCRGDIYNLPVSESSFGIVMVLEVLEHLKEPEKALNEIKRISKKYCIFSVPNEPYFKIMNMLRCKNISRFGNDIEHVQNWGADEFVTLLKKHFEVVNVKKPFPWVLVLCKIKE